MLIRFLTSTASSADALNIVGPRTLLHGDVVDERGRQAINAWRFRTGSKVLTLYDVDRLSVSLGKSHSEVDAIAQLLSEYDPASVVLEATTLGFAELFVLISGLIELHVKTLEIVYVEPAEYRRTQPGAEQFALTETTQGYQPIPRAVLDLSSDDVEAGVFFLGFEPERLDRALEEHQMITSKEVKVVFGVPAFHPGWELDSVIPHLPRLQQVKLEIDYCSANDPEAAFECLERTRASLGVGKKMFVAPIGPKPCGIAAAVFASVYPKQVGLLFDHPRRMPGRTDGALVWHRYQIQLDQF
jgi:hypothetical protein